jgi:hypothetical protein
LNLVLRILEVLTDDIRHDRRTFERWVGTGRCGFRDDHRRRGVTGAVVEAWTRDSTTVAGETVVAATVTVATDAGAGA